MFCKEVHHLENKTIKIEDIQTDIPYEGFGFLYGPKKSLKTILDEIDERIDRINTKLNIWENKARDIEQFEDEFFYVITEKSKNIRICFRSYQNALMHIKKLIDKNKPFICNDLFRDKLKNERNIKIILDN